MLIRYTNPLTAWTLYRSRSILYIYHQPYSLWFLHDCSFDFLANSDLMATFSDEGTNGPKLSTRYLNDNIPRQIPFPADSNRSRILRFLGIETIEIK